MQILQIEIKAICPLILLGELLFESIYKKSIQE